MLLLKKDITKKKQIDKMLEIEVEVGNNINYKLKTIWNGVVYARKLVIGHLLNFYYLIFSKSSIKEKNT